MEQPALKQSPSKVGFKIFVFSENRIYCLIILTLMMGQFIIFKLCYPFPDFFSDSYSYIEASFYSSIGLLLLVWRSSFFNTWSGPCRRYTFILQSSISTILGGIRGSFFVFSSSSIRSSFI